MIERIAACPLCGGSTIEELNVANLNSRVDELASSLAAEIGNDFFVHQRLAVCGECSHAFQIARPTSAGLEALYGRFQTALAKVTPTDGNMLEYVFRHNAKDYVELVARSLETLDSELPLSGVESALEVRTYGGALAALLAERGVPYVEAAYIQEFDASAARRLFGFENLVPFSFARSIAEFQPARERYDLIVMYEALTHSPDPHAVLDFLDRRLSENGQAVLFREPNNPRYRRYFPLEVVFNNFHLNLFNEDTVRSLISRDGRFALRLLPERHPQFPTPLYFTAIVARGGPAGVPAATRWDARFYRSWIRRDGSRWRSKLAALAARAYRRLPARETA